MQIYGHLVGLSVFCFLWKSHCAIPLVDGNAIFCSDLPEASTAKDKYIPLEFDDVKEKVKEIPENLLKEYLATNSELYKAASNVFTDLDSKFAMRYDYIHIKEDLKSIREDYNGIHSTSKNILELSKNLEKLEQFHKILSKGTEDRIKWLTWENKHPHFTVEGLNQDEESSETKIHLDLGLKINTMIWDSYVDDLHSILPDIPPKPEPTDFDSWKFFFMSLRLQKNILQTVEYMYSHKIITADALTKFLKMDNTLQITAFSIVYAIPPKWKEVCHEGKNCQIRIEFVNGGSLNGNYRSFYEVLDERNQRYLSYLCLKCFKMHNSTLMFIPDSLFEDDQLFKTLETQHSYLLGKSVSQNDIDNLGNNHPEDSQIQELLQNLIWHFQNSGNGYRSWRARMDSFYVLEFVKFHYGFGIMPFEEGEKLEERISSFSSCLQLGVELQKMFQYIEKKTADGYQSKKNQGDLFGEEILMIYNFHNTFISKNERFFMENPDIGSDYWYDISLNKRKEDNEKLIIEAIKAHQYYFHQK